MKTFISYDEGCKDGDQSCKVYYNQIKDGIKIVKVEFQ